MQVSSQGPGLDLHAPKEPVLLMLHQLPVDRLGVPATARRGEKTLARGNIDPGGCPIED
jgi:hypothetical protein